jgi:hypothetical protein
MMSCVRRITATLAGLLAIVLLSACRQTAFEQEHARSLAQNPAAIELRIATVGDAKTFRLPDPVKIEEFFSATYPRNWYIETADGWNLPTVSDEAYVSDGQTSFKVGGNYGFICCDSKHLWLDLDPLRVPSGYENRETYWPIPVKKPGKYQLYIVSYRAFGWEQNLITFKVRGPALTSSNILKVEVVQ